MCVKISLVKFTGGFPVFWLLPCILIADCFVILSVLPFWGFSHFAYVRSFWMRSHFECVLILKVFSFWMCSHFECVFILNTFSFWVCSHLDCFLILRVLSFWQYPRPHARLTRSHSPLFEEKKKMAQVSSQGYFGVLEDIRRSLNSVIWQLQSPDVSEETIHFLIHRLEQLSRHLLRIMQTVNMGTSEQILLEDVTRCISALCSQTATTVFYFSTSSSSPNWRRKSSRKT